MRKTLRTAALLLAGTLLCACSDIPDRTSVETAETTEETRQTEEEHFDELPVKSFDMETGEVFIRLNAEGGVTDGVIQAETGGEDGYAVIEKGQTLTHIVSVPKSQHYRVIVTAHSYSGASLKFLVQGETEGMYYVPASSDDEFVQAAIENIYLKEGRNTIYFLCESGSASIDCIDVEDGGAVSRDCYRTPVSPVSKTASVSAIGVMKYFTDNYGSGIITGQNVTPGTNAEIDAVFRETGRYPAMRCGEIALSLLDDKESADKASAELALGLDWGKRGGLVSYTWHWYSPDDSREALSLQTDFSLENALADIDTALVAAADSEQLSVLRANGMVSDGCIALLNDIDVIAQELKVFRDNGIAVVWQPIPNGSDDLYWWGGSAEEYKTLWRIMFDRMNELHGLGNLIWVWNGSSADFYPGDDYCDIVGQSIFEQSSSPFAGRFSALAAVSETETKPLAITACDRFPKPDYMVRDNAMWLWFAIESGDYIINTDGTLSERYIDWQSLHDCYNAKVCRTLDELPVFSDYALS